MMLVNVFIALTACSFVAADPLRKSTVLKWTWGSVRSPVVLCIALRLVWLKMYHVFMFVHATDGDLPHTALPHHRVERALMHCWPI
jgi:hypothetical protein